MATEKILDLEQKLKSARPDKIKAVIGFDGFVDEIVHVVDKRIDQNNFARLSSMADYAERIRKSAGLSTNIEMVTTQQKLGGNGPIFANALLEYGMALTYIGALGEPVHAVFSDMAARCQTISLTEPAHTDAIEFFDGKIISSKLKTFNNINWQTVLDKIGTARLAAILRESDLVGFENWTMILNMNDIWERILSDILPSIMPRDPKPVLFFDLADPEKREVKDILQALHLINRFSSHFNVVLGLNLKEACDIARILGMPVSDYNSQELQSLSKYIFSHMEIDTLVIHPVKEACAVSRGGFYRVEGPYCERPRLTTGAGDNFNAGFITGVMAGLGLEESLYLGTATSGYYVRNAKSPKILEVCAFLEAWDSGQLDA